MNTRTQSKSNSAGVAPVQPELLSTRQVCERLGFSKTYFYMVVLKRPGFPEPVMLFSSKKWFRDEIDAWLEELRRNRPSPFAFSVKS